MQASSRVEGCTAVISTALLQKSIDKGVKDFSKQLEASVSANWEHFEYTLCLKKNDNDVLRYNYNGHQPILINFGRDIAEWICY